MWFAYALLASVTWGINYVLCEQIFKHISVVTSLAISACVTGVVMGAVALFTGAFKEDIAAIASSPRLTALVALQILALMAAELFIGSSIQSKNATLAGLIEISYPLFIALFAWVLLKESSLTVGTVLGGALIFAGVATVYAFNR